MFNEIYMVEPASLCPSHAQESSHVSCAHNVLSTFSSIRRRYMKEKKVPASKIEKLLDVFPQVIFSSGMT